jgi:citrate synthase
MYLSAGEAAAYLGVSRSTLYAYVSRGLIVSEPEPGSTRSHRYPRSSLDALKARRERRRDPVLKAHGALSWGTPLLDSALTLIADGRLWYRGLDAVELSRTATFEEVAALLWTGSTEGAVGLFPRSRQTRGGSAGAAFADRIVACLVAARRDPAVTISEPSPLTHRAAGRTVRQLFDAVGATGPGTLAARLARGWGARDPAALQAALILCADHELNPSSFTARCVASTDASMQNVLLAALCALEGRRHGAMSERVEELVRDAERDGARPACRRALKRDGVLPGFGHPLYPDGDPRAAELIARAELPRTDVAAQIAAFARRELGVEPSLDFALVALARRVGAPAGGAFALFALGRSTGWAAHAFEAAASGELIRPRARYTGPSPSGAR